MDTVLQLLTPRSSWSTSSARSFDGYRLHKKNIVLVAVRDVTKYSFLQLAFSLDAIALLPPPLEETYPAFHYVSSLAQPLLLR